MKKTAAIDLWSQLLERAKSNDWSSFEDPEHVVTEEDRRRHQQAFLDAGWNLTDVLKLERRTSEQALSAPITSDGVNRNSEAMLQRLTKPLLSGLSSAELILAETAHFVVEPKAGPLVSTINVPMTNQSIIAMGTHFTRYCGLVSRAYVRTCNLLPFGVGTGCDFRQLRAQLRRDPRLLLYWWRIFSSYALTGTHVLTEFKPSTPREALLMEQMAAAMELFALAHELGHHCLSHGRHFDNSTDPQQDEFSADRFAIQLCEKIESTPEYQQTQGYYYQNPYLWTGAGGILLLGSIEIFRKVKEKIFHNPRFDTHPEFDDRADKIVHRNVLEPARYETQADFCNSARNVLKCVLLELEPIMSAWPFAKFVSKLPDDWELAQEGRVRTFY